MKALLGTLSKQKAAILRKAIKIDEVIQVEVESGIVDQPLDEKITIIGSMNRARNSQIQHKTNIYDFSIGLECGLELIHDLYHLVCCASIMDKEGNFFIGVGKKIALPKKVSESVKGGEQFGIAIRDFQEKTKSSDGGLLSHIDQLISREDAFIDAIQQAYTQYENKRHFTK